jgi:demethylmenaquinone methyltransferase/2-methoxy-6-polyprenyl-1,4-benzoquinol methylase
MTAVPGPVREDASGPAEATGAADLSRQFGTRRVGPGEKQPLVDAVFHKVAGRYDLMNDLMSLGVHRLWKNLLVGQLALGAGRAFRHLDVAGGTGDIAFRVARAGGPTTRVCVLDINPDMLAVGRTRARQKGLANQLDFVEANAEALPLADGSFDGYTIAFGIRNVPHIDRALNEAFRVLDRGGRFLCLEFSHVDLPGLDKVYAAWSDHVIPRMGAMIAGDSDSYRYLVESIRTFPKPEAFARMIEAAGFARVRSMPLSGGIVAIHSAWKM